MEEWQIKHIDRNLKQLISNTNCSVELKALLIEKQVITPEENNTLNVLGNTVSSYAVSEQLYGILKTRIDGYDAIMESLQKCRQTGAWKILYEGFKDESIRTLQDQSQQLLDLTIEIRNRQLPIKKMLPSFTDTNALNALECAEINQEFRNVMLMKQPVLRLDAKIPDRHKLYIKRFISNRLLLDPKVFTKDSNDVFVFKDFEKRELVRLLSPNLISSSNNLLCYVNSKHIYLEDEEDWDDIFHFCQEKKPVHLVCKEGSDFVLTRSTQVTDIIFQYSSVVNKETKSHLFEDDFAKHLCWGAKYKGSVLCDIPGMGKTCLMESLAKTLNDPNASNDTLVFFIHLSSFNQWLESFPKTEQRHFTQEETLMLSIEYACESKLASIILSQMIANTASMNAAFFMDGIDEVGDINLARTTSFLKTLSAVENVTLIISSRPHLRRTLEVHFKAVSYDILPFGREEQIKAIVGFWRQKFSDGDETLLTAFANQCVTSVKKIQHANTSDILGVPLMCYIMANVNELYAEKVLEKNRRRRVEVPPEATIRTINELFEKFVDTAVQKVTGVEKRQRMLKIHTCLALEELFPEIGTVYSNDNNVAVQLADFSDSDTLRADCFVKFNAQIAGLLMSSFIKVLLNTSLESSSPTSGLIRMPTEKI